MVYDIDTDIKTASRKAHEVLYGSKVVQARYLSKEEVTSFGWYKSGLVLWLKTKEGNTIQMIVQQDDEGNDSGVIDYLVKDKKGEKIEENLFYNIHI